MPGQAGAPPAADSAGPHQQDPSIVPTTSTEPTQPTEATLPPSESRCHTWHGPEADPHPSSQDTDSAPGSYPSTHSTSLASSVYAYRYENGRRYHASRDGTDYNLPNDDLESNRLDLQHHLFYLTFGGTLHRAPLGDNIHEVLDVGTGTGVWAVDFADQYQSAQVTGVDLSPIQPVYVPPNCKFYIEDVEAQWSFAPGTFDYIHGRMLVVGIRNWPRFFSQAFDALKPGGWVEIQDLCFPLRCDDGSAGADSPLLRWSDGMIQGAGNLGLDLRVANTFAQRMKEAGFTDVKQEWYAWPMNRWPKDKREKEKGMWVNQNFADGLQAFSMGFYTKGLGWMKGEVDVLVEKAKAQSKDRNSHIYLPIGAFYAKKPDIRV